MVWRISRCDICWRLAAHISNNALLHRLINSSARLASARVFLAASVRSCLPRCAIANNVL